MGTFKVGDLVYAAHITDYRLREPEPEVQAAKVEKVRANGQLVLENAGRAFEHRRIVPPSMVSATPAEALIALEAWINRDIEDKRRTVKRLEADAAKVRKAFSALTSNPGTP